jgi:proteasome accessory factor C
MAGSRATAGEQLDRLLYILPVAAREGGCRLDELAQTLGTTIGQVVHDLEEVTARAYYHPAGGADNLQILIDGDRVRIWTTGEFRRPLKLSPLEALALALGFRVLAAEQDAGRRSTLLATASRIESQAAIAPAEPIVDHFAVDPGDRGGEEIHAAFRQAVKDRRQCRIEYLKANDPAAETRIVHPYALVRADAGWYALAYCSQREDVRAFRLDRVIRASLLRETFEVPAGFEAEEWVAPGGCVFRAPEDVEVTVRYSPRIARWVREKGPVEEQEDGSVVVRYRVADPDWLIRHVLQYGADAEILGPDAYRQAIAAVLRPLLR